MKSLVSTTAVILALFGTINSAEAANDSTSFAVKLTVTSTCDISSVPATDIDFNSNTSKATNVDSTGTLTVNCTSGTPYTIGLTEGSNDDNGTRRMVGQDSNNAGVFVPYQLYTNSSRSTPWNNDTNVYGGTGTGGDQAVTVYARVASMNVAAGDYLDTVTATITY